MTRRAHKGAVVAVGVLLTVVGAGCGHPVQRKLEGRWIGEGVENFDERVAAAATGWAKGTSLEFAGSTLTVAIPAEEPRSGSYKVVSVHQNDVQLAVLGTEGAKDTLKLKLDDERSMRWILGSGRTLLLRKE